MKTFILICVTLLLGLTSCKSKANTVVTQKTEMTENNNQSQKDLNDIWALESMDGSDYSMKNLKKGAKIPILEFHLKDMRYAGNDGCNSIFGALDKVTANELKFGAGGATRMFCVDDLVSPAFNKNMHLVKGYSIEKTTLTLLDESGNVLMTFRKVD